MLAKWKNICEQLRSESLAYLLSFEAVLELSILATTGSDEVRAEAKLASGVPDSPSDETPLRTFGGAMGCVFVRLRICCSHDIIRLHSDPAIARPSNVL